MAKITFSGLVSQVTGKFHGSVLRKGRGGVVLMDGYKPQPASRCQRIQRGYVSNYSVGWYSLTVSQKELWNKYASLLRGAMTGFDAYMKLNMRLALSNHDDLGSVVAPPASPSVPIHVVGLTVNWIG